VTETERRRGLTAVALSYLGQIQTMTILISQPSLVFIAATALATSALAQGKIEFPATSQHSVVKQRVGLTDIEIDYSRPNKNNREIFGGLVPFGRIWRTGANATTKLRISEPVKLGDKEIPAGEYGIFTIPNANEWTFIVSKDTNASASEYKQENDAARVTVTPAKLAAPVETFTIGFTDVKGASATLYLDWDQTRVPIKLTTDDIEQVSKQLETAASAGTPLDPATANQAAGFYYDNNKDLNQAAKWIDQALEKNPDAYFMHFRRAQIQAKLGNKKEAVAAAQRTIEILKASKAPDEAAIKSAQQLIDAQR
jgi:tetratricopeptide (TPR) repeat protein